MVDNQQVSADSLTQDTATQGPVRWWGKSTFPNLFLLVKVWTFLSPFIATQGANFPLYSNRLTWSPTSRTAARHECLFQEKNKKLRNQESQSHSTAQLGSSREGTKISVLALTWGRRPYLLFNPISSECYFLLCTHPSCLAVRRALPQHMGGFYYRKVPGPRSSPGNALALRTTEAYWNRWETLTTIRENASQIIQENYCLQTTPVTYKTRWLFTLNFSFSLLYLLYYLLYFSSNGCP